MRYLLIILALAAILVVVPIGASAESHSSTDHCLTPTLELPVSLEVLTLERAEALAPELQGAAHPTTQSRPEHARAADGPPRRRRASTTARRCHGGSLWLARSSPG